ncbi:MAG: hypothetical protein LBB05_02275, partial [Puniceicoccales bacterium]|nr:hypothetical protein [Puniceicoccales bacterium]
ELKKKREQLHQLQMQAAQKNVELAQAKLNGGDDINAKQSELDMLDGRVKILEIEVKSLQLRIIDSKVLADAIIQDVEVRDTKDDVTLGDIMAKAAAIREDVAASDSSEAEESDYNSDDQWQKQD